MNKTTNNINNTKNTKGAKMRKFILPLLVAGAVAFVASQAMAAGTFTETGGSVPGISSTLPSPGPNPDNHYKTTDLIEHGHTTYQMSSAILNAVESSLWDGDTSYGYNSGSNPFSENSLTGTSPLSAPDYSEPCPRLGDAGLIYGCNAKTFATDPQNNDIPGGEVEYRTILDDVYQALGEDDSTTGVDRLLTQRLDDLFYIGDAAKVKLGTTSLSTSGSVFNISDVLDQDVADYTTPNAYSSEGIYGKLSMVFQVADTTASALAGCASKWNKGQSENGTSLCAPVGNNTSARDGLAAEADYGTYPNYQTFYLDQLMRSDMYDWAGAGLIPTKGDTGIQQSYSSWITMGQQKVYNYDRSNQNHGDLTGNGVSSHETHPDP